MIFITTLLRIEILEELHPHIVELANIYADIFNLGELFN